MKLSIKDYPTYSRVIIESSFPLRSTVQKASSFLIVKMRARGFIRIQRVPFESWFIKSVKWSKGADYYLLTIETVHPDFGYDSFTTTDPPQLVIDISPKTGVNAEDASGLTDRKSLTDADKETKKTASTSLFQGMRMIVIDPGHGGMESGAKGKFGSLEKDITLGISLKLRTIIERNLPFRVVLTRQEDVDKSLEERAATANNNKAYLFISVHANSSYRKKARGPETFFLNLNATDEEARRLAYLENNSAQLDENIQDESEDEIKMILWDMAQAAYLKQSSQLAESIQKELNSLFNTRNRGIKQAPFKVLTGVACPAVLIEVAFLSNPEEEGKLIDEAFQNDLARAVYRGLNNFLKLYSQE